MTSEKTTSLLVKEYALNAGAAVVGIAAAKDFVSAPEGFKPVDVMEDCCSVIVLGCPVPQEAILSDDTVGFIDIRNAVNKKVTGIANDLEKWLKRQKYKAKSVTGMSGKWVERDGVKRQVGPISLKHAAELAGLGIIGRNYLLTNPQYGNILWFGAVLTDADLASDQRIEQNFCNDCNICAEACPSGALNDYPTTFERKKCEGSMFRMVNKKWEIMCFNCRKMCPHRFGIEKKKGE